MMFLQLKTLQRTSLLLVRKPASNAAERSNFNRISSPGADGSSRKQGISRRQGITPVASAISAEAPQ